ncbi:MAG: class I SAM-dependent methyltransferase [Acidobacteriaceae bacterium]|nr:class I SAM-dependent methyltransferase [Acidobacteriaceae bacterium]
MPSIATEPDPVWEQIFSHREWGKYPPEHVVRYVARTFYPAPERSKVHLLEIGCGPGANVWFMAREGFRVSGIDGSATAIRKARERLAKEGLSADLHVGNFMSLPWADNAFDGVLENVSLCSNRTETIRMALAEVLRVLKRGAPFQASFFTTRTWGYGTGTKVEPDGFRDMTEGPLVGTGFWVFLTWEKLDDLFRDFADRSVERISWTMENEKHLVEQFVITCRKPER